MKNLLLPPIFSKISKSVFARNWSFLTLSNILCQILGMFATIRVARVLAPEGFGYLGLVQVNAGIGVIIASYGLQRVVTRECARHPEKALDLYRKSLLIQLFLFVIVAIVLLFYSVYLSKSMPFSLSLISLLLMFGMLTFNLIESLAFGHERMEFSSILHFAGSLIWVLFAWLTPVAFMSTFMVCLVFAVIQLIKSASYIVSAIQAGLLKSGNCYVSMKFLIKNGLPFYWLAILTAATNQLPILFLAERANAIEVGLFSAGLKLARPMQMMIQTLMLSLYPSFSRLTNTNPDLFRLFIQRSLLGLVVCGTFLACFVTIFRVEIVHLLFGAEFVNAADCLVLQIWYFALTCVFNIIGTTLAASDKHNWLAKLATITAIISVPILWYGSSFGATGLATAMLIGACINLTYNWLVFQRSLTRKFSLPFCIGLFGFPVILAILSFCIHPTYPFLFRIFSFTIMVLIFGIYAWKQLDKNKLLSI